MVHTQSATELTAVLVEPVFLGASVNVWLRKNIETVEVDLGDGLTQQMWEADEVSGCIAAPMTAAEIEEDFDEWWDALERASKTDAEKIQEAYDLAEQAAAQAWFTAVMTDTEV